MGGVALGFYRTWGRTREYDEATHLGAYLYWYEAGPLTDEECRAIQAVLKEAKSELRTTDTKAPYNQRLGEAYRRAGERVLREVHDLSFLNRCSRCGRIVRTPQARQCMWCHHDWHEAPNSP
jgi:hypothetical protein